MKFLRLKSKSNETFEITFELSMSELINLRSGISLESKEHSDWSEHDRSVYADYSDQIDLVDPKPRNSIDAASPSEWDSVTKKINTKLSKE